MTARTTTREARLGRHRRVRLRVRGGGERPRLCVFRSLNHIYVQVCRDDQGRVLVAASSLEPALRSQRQGKTKTEVARLVGALIAQRAVAAGISQVVFDRGGYWYHGRTKALAEAAREGGLKF